MSRHDKTNLNLVVRFKLSVLFVFLLFFSLLLRLWYLQVVRSDYFRIRSESNRIRTIYVQPPRGMIYDRNGTILVKNRPGFNIEIVTEDTRDPIQTVKEIAALAGVQAEELLPKLKGNLKRRRYEPKLILKDVSRDVVARVLARRHKLPGVLVNVTPTRDYVYQNLASHTLGYIREITREQLESEAYQGYIPGELIGQFGVESKLETYLQGERGLRAVIVDATGSRIGDAYYQKESPGNDVVLTLDKEMQEAAELALLDKKGAIVALDANNGEILTMASKPDFNPNMFAAEVSSEIWKSLSGREKKLSNRVAQGGYPPGSVFKIFMAYAALNEKLTTPQERIFCPGYLHFAGRNYKCHKHSGHGYVNLEESLIMSCDVYYYTIGQRLGVDKIHQYATLFGLGRPTKFDLHHEHPGLIPSTEWKRKAFRKREDQKWYAGETLSVSIGQGAVVTTPLQLARAVATMLNGGKLIRPHVIKEVHAEDAPEYVPVIDGDVEINSAALEPVKRGLLGVVSDARGTGRRANLKKEFDVDVAGKTGTAQVVSLSVRSKSEHLKDHAWFLGYAPAEKPEIVVVALAENGGHGGAAAAPMVNTVMQAYFSKTRGPLIGPPKPKELEGNTDDAD